MGNERQRDTRARRYGREEERQKWTHTCFRQLDSHKPPIQGQVLRSLEMTNEGHPLIFQQALSLGIR